MSLVDKRQGMGGELHLFWMLTRIYPLHRGLIFWLGPNSKSQTRNEDGWGCHFLGLSNINYIDVSRDTIEFNEPEDQAGLKGSQLTWTKWYGKTTGVQARHGPLSPPGSQGTPVITGHWGRHLVIWPAYVLITEATKKPLIGGTRTPSILRKQGGY